MKDFAILLLASVILTTMTGLAGCNGNDGGISGVMPPAPGKSNLAGTVIGPDGQPLQGATILLCRDGSHLYICTKQMCQEGALGLTCLGSMGATVTDVAGDYLFRNIPPGRYVPAVQMSATKTYFLTDKSTHKEVVFIAEGGKTTQVDRIQIAESPTADVRQWMKVRSPINSESISERSPTLSWEPVPNADHYIVFLFRMDGDKPVDIRLLDEGNTKLRATSLKVPAPLDDGVYLWEVLAMPPEVMEEITRSRREDGYFVVSAAQ